MIRPMLAGTTKNIEKVFSGEQFLLSYKYDGIRCIIKDGIPISRSGKVFRNKYIQKIAKEMPNDYIFDGELFIGNGTDSFSNNTSGIMTTNKELPDIVYMIFDIAHEDNAMSRYNRIISKMDFYPKWCSIAPKVLTNSFSVYLAFYEVAMKKGYEGVMIQLADGKYKNGRSTLKEKYLIKTKEINDEEAIVIGFTELTKNLNESKKDELGYSKKSSAKDSIIKQNSLGSLICVTKDSKIFEDGIEFKIGTGFTEKMRKEIWENRDSYVGKIVKYSSLSIGVKDAPRNPSFIGFRDPDDM